MSAAGDRPGVVVVDCAALQSPTGRGRGIGRYALEWATAIETVAPDLVAAYVLDPALGPPPPGEADTLLTSGKVVHRGTVPLPDGARVWHTLSPLDLAVGLETIWPGSALRPGLRRSATVYDLIPAKDPATHLGNPADLLRYRVRLEALRGADQVHAISGAVGADLRAVLGLPPERVVAAGAAPSARFWDLRTCDPGAPHDALAGLGLSGRFVLYPTGSHPRKNNEGLLAAWALLPEGLRGEVRLVLTGDLPAPMAHHLRHLAEQGGFPGGVVVTGLVTEKTLLALYRAAELVCFPSLEEGYGLPVAEALACGTPVVATDRAPLDELLGEAARFDPEDPVALAGLLEAVLGDPSRRAEVVAAGTRPDRWEDVARRSAEALAALAGPDRRPRHAPRRRLAMVSPFPPSPSGVARYSAHLVEALVGLGGVEVDCFADGPTPDQVAPGGAAGMYPVRFFAEVARLRGGYDEVLLTLGNSHHHLGALDVLRRRGGVVLAHDVRLTNLYLHERSRPGARPGGLAGALGDVYGDVLPEGADPRERREAAELERLDLLMAREAVTASRSFLVTSDAAVALARSDARPADAAKIRRLPFAFAAPANGSPSDAAVPAGRPVVAHFGIVDPSKQPFLVLEAFATVSARLPGARLAFVGPVSDALAEGLRRRAEALGILPALTVAGAVGDDEYAAALAETSVAVQLRASTNGEASAAIGDCLAAGVPTVVTEVGWARELPEEAVVRVDRHVSARALGACLVELVEDDARRARLAKAGREEASRRSFEVTARALVDRVGLGEGPVGRTP